MMQVIGTYLSDAALQLETSEKVRGKKQLTVVYSRADVDRLYFFWNRLYIIERMTSFLHQRIFAYRLAGLDSFVEKAEWLLDALGDRSLSGLSSVCKLIVDQEATITAMAPSAKAVSQYTYYNNTIKSIIAYCKNPQGENI